MPAFSEQTSFLYKYKLFICVALLYDLGLTFFHESNIGTLCARRKFGWHLASVRSRQHLGYNIADFSQVRMSTLVLKIRLVEVLGGTLVQVLETEIAWHERFS